MSLASLSVDVPAADYVAVEYPGFVRNVDQALQSFGGAGAVADVAHGRAAYLKISFRPTEPTAHPIYGAAQSTCRLLLRISRPKQPSQPPTADQSTSGQGAAHAAEPVTAQVVARLPTTVLFQGMSDFQFVPLDPHQSTRDFSSVPYDHQPEKAEPSGTRQPLLTIPPIFSKSDMPFDYAFKRFVYKPPARAKPMGPRAQQNATAAAMAAEAASIRTIPAVSFYSEGVPQQHMRVPPQQQQQQQQSSAPGAATDAGDSGPAAEGDAAAATLSGNTADTEQRAFRAVLPSLLEQRPVWSPASICAALRDAVGGTHVSAVHVEQELLSLVYRFRTGPWRGLYVRRGYDPRTDPAAKRYQIVTYRLPQDWYEAYQRRTQPLAYGVQGLAQGSGQGTTPPPDISFSSAGFRGVHSFQQLPTTREVVLQLCDLQDSQLSALLEESGTSGASAAAVKCSESNGFFVYSTMQQIQGIINRRFQSLIDTPAVAPSTDRPMGQTDDVVMADAADAVQLPADTAPAAGGASVAGLAAPGSAAGQGTPLGAAGPSAAQPLSLAGSQLQSAVERLSLRTSTTASTNTPAAAVAVDINAHTCRSTSSGALMSQPHVAAAQASRVAAESSAGQEVAAAGGTVLPDMPAHLRSLLLAGIADAAGGENAEAEDEDGDFQLLDEAGGGIGGAGGQELGTEYTEDEELEDAEAEDDLNDLDFYS